MVPQNIKAIGLDGVVASETELSFIDGQAGVLLYRGYDIHDLASGAGYLETLYLLWHGRLPTLDELEEFRTQIREHRKIDDRLIEVLRQIPSSGLPMDALRTGVSALGTFDPGGDDHSTEALRGRAIRLAAKIPTIVAAFDRLRNDERPVDPDPSLSHTANFLYMLRGDEPTEVEARALDTSLLLYLEHGLNASTFTCRVIASTLADLHSAICGGIGALKGSLHGGANQKAMEMLLEIGDADGAEAWVDEALSQKKKIMGFGHRVYKTEDPRATHLRRMSEELTSSLGEPRWHEIATIAEETMLDRKGIHCNVDFYCAPVYYTLGLPLDLFTPLFAMGRIGGWSAHVMEQQADNRLIRPRAEYVGPKDRAFVPIEDR